MAIANLLGNASLERFDVVIVGSGAGGAAAAYVLTSAGLDVLILEAGDNNFPGLDDPAPGMPVPRYGNDELKGPIRLFDRQDPVVEPRTFRAADTVAAQPDEDVNLLNRTVGGTTVHADMKYPRFNAVDFRLASALADAGRLPADASFIDWPLSYDELEPWYLEAERITGVAGLAGADPFASPRSAGYPMPPSPEMYVGRLLSEGSRRAGYTPFPYPAAINSRPYPPIPAFERPPCVNCGFCSGFGCPNNAKSSAAVTTLRAALLSGRCQLRFNCHARQLVAGGDGGSIAAVEYVDPDGGVQTVAGDRVILAASAMESVRLLLLSDLTFDAGPAFHLGRHMLFHYQTIGVGIFKQRIHGERGQSVTNGISDLRGVSQGGSALDGRPLGGIVEFGTSSEPIGTGKSARQSLDVAANIATLRDTNLKRLLVESPFHAHIAVLIMQAEDAPQAKNRVDLDPTVRDVHGLPVVRLTYTNHRFELDASSFYRPELVRIMELSGAQFGFVDPTAGPPRTRHVLGGLRMGSSPDESVTDAFGRLHGFDNLYCMDGAVMPTGSGYNPTLTLIALALRSAAHLVDPESPERRIGQGPLSPADGA
jgi:gluconate 2-dehydrogenase alpha chain